MPTTKQEKESGWLSVTEVLDAFIPKGLLAWYLKTGAKEAKRLGTVAMKIGSRVDELIQADINGTKPKFYPKANEIEVANCMDAWHKFKQDYDPIIEACQIEVKSEEQKLVGHIDLIMDGRVVDIKCASSIKQNYWLQVAKYLDMKNMTELVDSTAILRLDKNLGTYQFMVDTQAKIDNKKCVEVFDGLLTAYRFYNPPTEEKEEICQT